MFPNKGLLPVDLVRQIVCGGQDDLGVWRSRPAAERAPGDGVLLVGHGTREKQGVVEFFKLAGLIQAGMPGGTLAPCFLEFARPTIRQGVERLARAEARRIRVVPLLLFAAGHVRRDIPKAVAAAAAPYPDVAVLQTPHLGCSPPVVALSAQRFLDALGDSSHPAAADTVMVLVGRGNRDVRALAEMQRFAELRRELTPVAHMEVCFLAMARPRLPETLVRVAQGPEKRVVVQPHLLLPGKLVQGVNEAVQAIRRQWPAKTWLVAQPLGPDRLIVEAVLRTLSCGRGGREVPLAMDSCAIDVARGNAPVT
jgi:sirohydrochlorin cobaltochelatase